MNALTDATSQAGTVTRDQLSALDLGFETRRLIDQSRGIWNPRDLQATLSVLSTPSGPYDDAALDGSVFRYDYRAGSTDGEQPETTPRSRARAPHHSVEEGARQGVLAVVPGLCHSGQDQTPSFPPGTRRESAFVARPFESDANRTALYLTSDPTAAPPARVPSEGAARLRHHLALCAT